MIIHRVDSTDKDWGVIRTIDFDRHLLMVNDDCSVQDIYSSHQERWCNPDMMCYPVAITARITNEGALTIKTMSSWKIVRGDITFTYAVSEDLLLKTTYLDRFGWYR